MSELTKREKISTYFVTGASPTQREFKELIDAFVLTNHEKDDPVGLGVEDPINTLDVNGNVVIGSQYAGATGGPEDGLCVEGKTGIGNDDPQEQLHLTGNLRIDEGGLKFNNEFIITSEGEWNGSPTGLVGPQGPSGTSSWTDEDTRVHTALRVGIGTDTPDTELHVDGYVTKQHVGFTVDDVRRLEGDLIVFRNPLTNISESWDSTSSIFTAPVAGCFHFTASYIPADNTDSYLIEIVRNGQTLLTIWDSNDKSPMGSASIVTELQIGDTIAMKIIDQSGGVTPVQRNMIRKLNFTGYRI